MKCDLCGKIEKNFDGCVWWSGDNSKNLCRSHYLKWCKYNKSYIDSHKHIKPCTKAWYKMCAEEQRLFDKWFKKEKTKLTN